MNNKISLFIDTSITKQGHLKILDNNFVQLHEVTFHTNNNLVDVINEHIANLFTTNNFQFSQVTKLFLNLGPNSFTGIRVGVSVAKAFALLLPNLEIYTINALKLMCRGHGIAIIDAKSEKSYFAVYDNNKELIKPCLVSNQEVELLAKKYNYLSIVNNECNKWNIEPKFYKYFDKVSNNLDLEPLYIKPAL